MRLMVGMACLLAITDSRMLDLLEQSFYPGLFLIFVVASLGVPIPEDIPLILAGFLIKTNPEIARWELALPVSLVGIMSGDVILYTLGRRWGRNIFEHRSVSWLITPQRMAIMDERFHRWGAWACFFGRFMMGVRAMMCLTAGVTRFPFWKFFLADFAGALISAPFFIWLGYKFAEHLPLLQEYLKDAQIAIFVVVGLLIVGVVWYEVRRLKKIRAENAAARTAAVAPPTDAGPRPLTEKSAAELRIPPPRSKPVQQNA
jgi:membrane protein DedA with SNARE-associated domain